MMHDDMRQQLVGIQQQLLELRQEVGETRQQLAHMQAQVSTLYGLGQYIRPRHMMGLRHRHQSMPQVPLAPQTESISQPVNLLSRNTVSAKLQEDVMYAIQIAQGYLHVLAANQVSPQGKVVLEIGPGINYGSVLVLACYGAKTMVTDRFLAPWDPDYHPLFYALLRDAIQEHMSGADVRPIQHLLAHGGYTSESIRCYAAALEELPYIPTASVDIIFSNAVLEHIYDPPTAFKSLARISAPGGKGFHQVDFRDHRCMERPLEFLLMSEAEFAQEFAQRHGECGNRYRPWEYAQLFDSVGFQVLQFEPSACADAAYLEEFIPRLRATAQAKERYTEAEKLKVVSGAYVVTRQGYVV